MNYSSTTPPFAPENAACGSESCSDDDGHVAASLGLQMFHPHPLLADLVEDIWDWDLADGAMARRITLRMPPSAYAFLALQYRVPIVADWTFGTMNMAHSTLRNVACKVESGVITARPVGPIGTVIVRIKPEAVGRVMHAPLGEFLNQKIDLSDIFKPHAITRVEDALLRARDAATRVALVEDLLLHEMRPVRRTGQLIRAVASLRFNPSLSVRDLALQLDISVRHLSRCFKAAFGTGPKQFARLVRVEKALAARREGWCWTDIAHACGFADQAHLIHDFRAITGVAPEEIFRPPEFKAWTSESSMRARPFFNLFIG